MRILGLDPGLNTTGYGVIDVALRKLTVVEAGVILGGADRDLAPRLDRLFDGLTELVQVHRPEVAAIEELYSHYDRPRTAILMGHARGVLCLAIHRAGLPVHSYAATQIKRILTGNGRAGKSQVQQAVARQLQLHDVPDPPDVADALAAAMCHHFLCGKVKST
jgi:crossover junction endodeoxyribonuclease RuvC